MHEIRQQAQPSHTAKTAVGQGPAGETLPTAPYITRAPLLNAEGRVVGYELGVRPHVPLPVLPGAHTRAQIEDEALLSAVIDLEYQQALGDKLTLLALSTAGLASPLLSMLRPARTLLVITDLLPSEAHTQDLTQLLQEGFGLVLEDVVGPAPLPPIPARRYVRLDLRQHNAMSLGHSAVRARQQGAHALIARHVDTWELFDACRRLAFDLVQGEYYLHAPASAGRQLQAGRVVIMDLLNLVMGHADFPVIETKFKQDAALSYKLLRYINSAAVGLRYPVKSIGQALVLLGHDQLYRWLTLLLFAHTEGDPRSRTLLRHAVVRARLTELLGEAHLPKAELGGLFIAGILSLLDSLLGLPLAQALEGLQLPPSVLDALLHDTGPYAPYLQLARACEQFDQTAVAALCERAGLTAEVVNLAHVNALIWSEGLED